MILIPVFLPYYPRGKWTKALVLEVFAPWGADGVRAQPGKQAQLGKAWKFGEVLMGKP